jgi:hypothetical protein
MAPPLSLVLAVTRFCNGFAYLRSTLAARFFDPEHPSCQRLSPWAHWLENREMQLAKLSSLAQPSVAKYLFRSIVLTGGSTRTPMLRMGAG